MAYFDFITDLEDEFSGAALTIRQQARLDQNLPDLVWDALAPRENVDSIKLEEFIEPDFRPIADRREWNADGRHIPTIMGDLRDLEMVPIEDWFSVGEKEIQRLNESLMGQQSQVVEMLKRRLPDRVNTLADGNFRRIEVDLFTAWLNGEIVVRNPQTGNTTTVSLNFDSNRFVSEDWSGGNNAYDLMVARARKANKAIPGGISGAFTTEAVALKLQKDAPRQYSEIRPSFATLQERIQDDLGFQFNIRIDDNRAGHEFTGADSSYSEYDYFQAEKFAFVPNSGRIGSTYFAPVYRAQQYANQVTDDSYDIRGVQVFPEVQNNGKQLRVEAQLNALPYPNENNVYVVTTSIT